MKDSIIFDVIIKDAALLKQLPLNELNLPSKSSSLFAAYWVGDDNTWMYSGEIDPLSAVLLVEQLEPYRKGDDDLAVATLANLFKRHSGWVKSFQIGILGQTNSGTSISGYLMGREVKKKLCLPLTENILVK